MACCPGDHAAAMASFTQIPPAPAEATSTPAWSSSFHELNVKSDLGDGYWIEAFPFRTKAHETEGPVGPELIGYGLGYVDKKTKQPVPSEVRMYLNPFHEMKNQIAPPTEWAHTSIATLQNAVACTYGNFRPKSNLNDLVICHNYGASMDDLNMNGGDVTLFVNPGDREQGNWVQKHIGKFPAMHRLKTGYFTQKKHVEIMALPIMIKSGDRESPAPVIIYKPTEWDSEGVPSKWDDIRPLDDTFRLIHEVQIIHSTTGGLDKAMVAGREGISLMWMDEKTNQWKHENVGTGIPQTRKPFKNPYWGSGSVATARVHGDSVGYIATCEAFHGNLVSVYVKPPGTRPDQIVTNEHWRRFVIDDFGPLKGNSEFTGTIHNVVCADLDGSGVESIIVACMGYPEVEPDNMGTYVYTPLDLQRGLFTRRKISNASAGRLAVADFRCSGTLDIAAISYCVPNYLESKDPSVRCMLNNTKQTRHAIKAQKLGDEVMIRVPRAASTTHISEMPFLDIGGKRLSIVVVPPNKEYQLGEPPKVQGKEYPKDGVKVINGEISWNEGSNRITRGIAVEAQKAKSMIPNADDNIVKAGPNGAIFVRLASSPITTLPDLKFEDMDDVATINNLPFSVDPAVRDMLFPWVRCSDREWGQGGFDWPFYNLVGYHVLYDDDSLTNFCHIQAWTLGIGETAAFHNHDTKSFCEIHACISNGTGEGGMWWAKNEEADKHLQQNPNEIENVAKYANNVVVNDMEEHGPLWRMGSDGRPSLRPNDTVDYPYHAWLAGGRNKSHPPQAFDVWLAFEFPSSEFQEGRSKFNGCACC